jgi:hypothetical protein
MKRLFYDIETSKGIYSGFGQGWNKTVGMKDEIVPPHIVCICWQWEGSDEQFELRWDLGDDKKLVKKFIKVLDSADEICAHNGDGFDLPRIRARAIIHDLPMRFDYPSIDTLKLARKRAGKGFKFESNRLDYIARILGVGAKIPTNGELWDRITFPAFIPSLYPVTLDYHVALEEMVTYCHMDISVLKAVFFKLRPYVQHNKHHAVANGGEKWHCPECESTKVIKQGKVISRAGTISHRMMCKKCKKKYQISQTEEKKYQLWKST